MAKEEFFSPGAFEEIVTLPSGFAEGPERDLLRALLFDGIQAYFSYCLNTQEVVKEKFKEAYHWIHARDNDYVFSFQSVCEGLGLDSDALRLGISNFVNSNQVEQVRVDDEASHIAQTGTVQSSYRKAKRRQL
jgi:hypothetical protein